MKRNTLKVEQVNSKTHPYTPWQYRAEFHNVAAATFHFYHIFTVGTYLVITNASQKPIHVAISLDDAVQFIASKYGYHLNTTIKLLKNK